MTLGYCVSKARNYLEEKEEMGIVWDWERSTPETGEPEINRICDKFEFNYLYYLVGALPRVAHEEINFFDMHCRIILFQTHPMTITKIILPELLKITKDENVNCIFRSYVKHTCLGGRVALTHPPIYDTHGTSLVRLNYWCEPDGTWSFTEPWPVKDVVVWCVCEWAEVSPYVGSSRVGDVYTEEF